MIHVAPFTRVFKELSSDPFIAYLRYTIEIVDAMQTKADQFDADLGALAKQAKALSHPARLAILRVLAERNACICGEIVDDLPLAQSTVSRHLKVLKDAGLVQGTIDGPSVCYCLDRDALEALSARFNGFFAGLLKETTVSSSC